MSVIEAHNTINFNPVGRCIYCGNAEDLSDEHVIPLALNGNLILPSASCPACRRITSALERDILRGPFLAARVRGGYKTRRPKERPKTLPVDVLQGGKVVAKEVQVPDHPAVLTLPLFPPASFLTNQEIVEGITVTGRETLRFGDEPKLLFQRLNAETLRITDNVPVFSFARMLIKIGFSYAVGALGLDRFASVYIREAILGRDPHVNRWVGSHDFTFTTEGKGALHCCAVELVETMVGPVLVVYIKLFARSGATAYEVVIGQLS